VTFQQGGSWCSIAQPLLQELHLKPVNIHFPISVRRLHDSDQDLVGQEKLSFLEVLEDRPKEDQYLFYYNFLNQKRTKYVQSYNRSWPEPVYSKSKERANQTTFVLDFDSIHEESEADLASGIANMKALLGDKCLAVRSPSGGLHVVYFFNGKISEENYKRIQEAFVQTFFKKLSFYLDKNASLSLKYGFFHSQHIRNWANHGRLLLTPAKQTDARLFWNPKYGISADDILEILFLGHPLSNRSQQTLIKDFFNEASLYNLCMRSNDEEKRRRSIRAVQRGQAILVMGQNVHYRDKSLSEEICSRAQTEEYEAYYQLVKGAVGQGVCGAGGLQEVCGGPFDREEPSGSRCSLGTNEANQEGTCGTVLPGSSSQGDQHCDGHSDRLPADHGGGLPGNCSAESPVEFLQAVESLYQARWLSSEELGRSVQPHQVRSHGHRGKQLEESDYICLFECMREVLARSPGLGRYSPTDPGSTFRWIRHWHSSTRTGGHAQEILREFAQSCSIAWRLCHARVGMSFTDFVPESVPQADGAEVNAVEFLKDVEEKLETLMSTRVSERHKMTVRKLFREEQEFLLLGTEKLLKYLAMFAHQDVPVALGLEDVQKMFQTHVSRAGPLRKVLMAHLMRMEKDYVPCIKRREFYLRPDVLSKYVKVVNKQLDIEKELKDRGTWEAIRALVPASYRAFGLSVAEQMWHDALKRAQVNDLEKRLRGVSLYLQKLDKIGATPDADSFQRQKASY
jgi:hypothetical protein